MKNILCALLLGSVLSACGGNQDDITTKPEEDKAALEAKRKAEEEARKAEEEERLAREKAEAERKAREEADKIAEAKRVERERLAEIERERIAQEEAVKNQKNTEFKDALAAIQNSINSGKTMTFEQVLIASKIEAYQALAGEFKTVIGGMREKGRARVLGYISNLGDASKLNSKTIIKRMGDSLTADKVLKLENLLVLIGDRAALEFMSDFKNKSNPQKEALFQKFARLLAVEQALRGLGQLSNSENKVGEVVAKLNAVIELINSSIRVENGFEQGLREAIVIHYRENILDLLNNKDFLSVENLKAVKFAVNDATRYFFSWEKPGATPKKKK